MAEVKKWNILFMECQDSAFDLKSANFEQLFGTVDFAADIESTKKLYEANTYDMIISDLSNMSADQIAFLKEFQKAHEDQTIFALVLPKDTDKLYGIADMGINAFEITEEQFALALAEIAKFDPYAAV